jgi:hypothetical protein
MSRRSTRRLVGALTAALALTATSTALAIPPDGPVDPHPTVYVHQLVNTNTGKALTAGSSSITLSTRSIANTAQQFKRTSLPGTYLYRYESVKYPGKCMGASVAGSFGTPAMVACNAGNTAWRFYDPYMNPSRGIFTIETSAINNGHVLLPTGTNGVSFGSEYWTTGHVPAPSAFFNDQSVALD